jgi:hypothetical protein
VLVDLGVTIDSVRAEIDRLREDPALEGLEGAPKRPVRAPMGPQPAPEIGTLIRLATELAQSEGAPDMGLEHIKRVLSSHAATRLLELENRLRLLDAAKRGAIDQQDFEAAARYRDEQRQLRNELPQAKEAWKRSIRRRKRS